MKKDGLIKHCRKETVPQQDLKRLSPSLEVARAHGKEILTVQHTKLLIARYQTTQLQYSQYSSRTQRGKHQPTQNRTLQDYLHE